MLTTKAAIGGALTVAAVAIIIAPHLGMTSHAKRGPHVERAVSNTLGYLSPKELPNVVALLPPPPALGSQAMASDEKARQAALRLKGTPEYTLAAADAVRAQPNTAAGFECALGTRISSETTPRLYELLSRVRVDVRAASYPAKSHFRRPRPFVVHGMQTCAPADAAMVRQDGSYPSARAAVGWAYAAVLSELMPQRTDFINGRARTFALSRVVCGEEWQSDVDVAPIVASATLARERTKEAFRADMAASRQEVAAALAAPAKSSMSCSAAPRL